MERTKPSGRLLQRRIVDVVLDTARVRFRVVKDGSQHDVAEQNRIVRATCVSRFVECDELRGDKYSTA